MPALKQFTEQSQVRETYHRSDGSDTGSNSGGRRTTEKSPNLMLPKPPTQITGETAAHPTPMYNNVWL